VRTVVWQGLDEPRMELVRLEWGDGRLRASGTQLGVAYELRYELDGEQLDLDIVGAREATVALGGCDFFDLGNSPLFNSLPVVRDGLLVEGPPRDYVMRWVSVPELEVHEQPQRYEPLGGGLVRFSTGDFVADIAFDDDGLVTHYPDLADRLA
jgi:uncharacterized protein